MAGLGNNPVQGFRTGRAVGAWPGAALVVLVLGLHLVPHAGASGFALRALFII
jgi:hypothetical protein